MSAMPIEMTDPDERRPSDGGVRDATVAGFASD